MRSLLFAVAVVLTIAGCGGTSPPQLGPDMTPVGSTDMALKPFGAACTANAECASMLCFIGGNRSFCSLHCTAATQATDCPVPPTSGTCNMQGYCKP